MITIPMSSPDISAEEIDAVNQVLKSPVLSNGPYLTDFENAFAGLVGVDHAIGVNSGTSGLHLCIIAAGVSVGDYVITTPFSFVASANCILYERGIPVFADVDPQTGNIDPASVEEAMDGIVRRKKAWLKRIHRNGNGYANGSGNGHGRVKAILPVHAYGQPADMGPIMQLARKYEMVPVIEDACEAVGSMYNGKNAGTFGEYAVYAFYPNKQMTTAEGGMIACKDEGAARLFRSLRNQGRDVFDSWLNHDRLGFNYRMDELRAALGLIQLKRMDELLEKRERVAGWYNERLRRIDCLEVPFIAGTTTRMSWFVYVIRILPPADRNKVMEALTELGVPGRPYFTPIHLQSYYARSFGYKRGDFPVAERLGDVSLALPFSGIMTESQVDYVCENLRSVLKNARAYSYPLAIPGAGGEPEEAKHEAQPAGMASALKSLIHAPLTKRIARVVIDGSVVALSLAIAYFLRFDGRIPEPYMQQMLLVCPFIIGLYILSNGAMRVYGSIWRFAGLREAGQLARAVLAASAMALMGRMIMLYGQGLRVPLSVLLMQPALCYSGLVGVRLLRRLQSAYSRRKNLGRSRENAQVKRVLLAGAGSCGWMILGELAAQKNIQTVGFLDDDPEKRGRSIGGVRVLGGTSDLVSIARQHSVDEVIVTMPSAPAAVIRRILSQCESIPVRASAIPDVTDIALGRLKVEQLRPIRLEDLLGRSRVVLNGDDKELVRCYAGKRILVTGAGGSIGSELVRQVAKFRPSLVVMLDKDENSVYEMGLQIREEYRGDLVEVVADMKDRAAMRRLFEQYRFNVVFHAAAYKHVPMMEAHPAEAVLNNIMGSRNVIELAEEAGVERFVMISTDKAVNPSSVMGATKRVVEMIVRRQALGNGTTRFCNVRFGNVLGSRASVVPLFERSIAERKTIKVTHPEVKRYFMTIPEAVQLVIKAGSLGEQGETFALDMGDPVKIIDLAKEMIERAGLVPGKDIGIEFTGLRPGEKLFEEVFYREEHGYRSTKYPKIFVTHPMDVDGAALDASIARLENAARAGNCEEIYRCLSSMNIGYTNPRNLQVAAPAGLHRLSAAVHSGLPRRP